jgi:hypothetical protein
VKRVITLTFLILSLTACDASNPGGVLLNNEIPVSVLNYVRIKQIINKDEKIICYYDATIFLDNTESFILTDKRIIHHFNDRNVSIALNDIDSVEYIRDGVNDIIIVESNQGTPMKVTIAPLNDGQIFLNRLRRLTGK